MQTIIVTEHGARVKSELSDDGETIRFEWQIQVTIFLTAKHRRKHTGCFTSGCVFRLRSLYLR